jgi:hypothetical protein
MASPAAPVLAVAVTLLLIYQAVKIGNDINNGNYKQAGEELGGITGGIILGGIASKGVGAVSNLGKSAFGGNAVRSGFGVNDKAVRIQGPWTKQDIYNGLFGRPPKSFGGLDLHHADQMPGSAIHEIIFNLHRGNSLLHPNKFNQGVNKLMRLEDRKLHWWFRSREQGAELIYPQHIYNNF